MQSYDTPNTAFEAFKKELNLRKKTPDQIVAMFIKQGIITQPVAIELVELAEYKALIEEYENVVTSMAWAMVTKRSVEFQVTV